MRSGSISEARKSLPASSRGTGEVVRRHERATPQDSQESVVRELEAAVAELLDDEVGAIGFGVPSPIDQRRGVVVECVNLPLTDFPLREHMNGKFGRAGRPRQRRECGSDR